MLGILLIDKPPTWTSHDVVAKLRSILKTKRIGHAGTLDPLATGLLVVAVGPATRFLQYLPLEPKEYVCTIKFGIETDSYDADGQVVATGLVPANLETRLVSAFPDYVGEIMQLPPAFSAVKKDGKPLYAYARAGQEVERTARKVYIEEVELLSVEGELARVRIVCSGGTYVRTLAHDLGRAVGCGAHVVELSRTRVGDFALSDAVPLTEAAASMLIPLSRALGDMPIVTLNELQVDHIRHGRPIQAGKGLGTTVALADRSGNIVGIGRAEGPFYQPECVLPEVAVVGAVPS